MKRIDLRMFTGAVVAAVLALAGVSCAKVTGGGSPSGADDNGGVTSAGPAASAATPTPSNVATVGTQQAVLPAGSNSDRGVTTPVQDEIPVTPPSPAVLRRVNEAQGKLDAITSGLDGTRVRFVDCAETASCSARLEATSLAGLRDLLQAVSAQQGGIGFVAREQLDAYTGRTFVADVTLGGTDTRPVPTDENELLVN
jgi:hypothetical protein